MTTTQTFRHSWHGSHQIPTRQNMRQNRAICAPPQPSPAETQRARIRRSARPALSVISRRGHPPWRWLTAHGVTAAVVTELMLTILSLADGAAPPWPCSG
jgi:hypothetical protein